MCVEDPFSQIQSHLKYVKNVQYLQYIIANFCAFYYH